MLAAFQHLKNNKQAVFLLASCETAWLSGRERGRQFRRLEVLWKRVWGGQRLAYGRKPWSLATAQHIHDELRTEGAGPHPCDGAF